MRPTSAFVAALVALAVGGPTLAADAPTSVASVSFVQDPQKQVLVLMYHQVTTTPAGVSAGVGHYGDAVPPKRFDADLTYMERQGFHAVDPLAVLAYLNGQAHASSLPNHPYAVTFDDGYISAWTEATPILQRHHMKAMMFIEAIRIDRTPGRLTSEQIRVMARSGTWEIESHGYTGHWALQIGPKPTDLSPYWYANLGWLPAANRQETVAEFEDRLVADFRRSRETLTRLSGSPVTVFAYPSGEYGQNIPLPPGGNPDVFANSAGHSNAIGLTPVILDALRQSGFTAAFAVGVPGSEKSASQHDAPYLIPRIAGNPSAIRPDIRAMSNGELRLPEISPSYAWLDCQPVVADGKNVWVIGKAQPYTYHIDGDTGRVKEVVRIPALQWGRVGQPILAAGLVEQMDGSFLVYEQKGWWTGGQPRLISFRLAGGNAVDVKTVILPQDANWFVGLTRVNQGIIGLTETGQFYELAMVPGSGPSVSQLFSLPNDAPDWKQANVGRFAGITFAHGLLYVADRKTGHLLGIDPANGGLKESMALPAGSDVRAVGGDDQHLWLVDYSDDRRQLIRMRSTQGASR